MLEVPRFLDNVLRVGGEIESLTHRPLSKPQKYLYLSIVLISVKAEQSPGPGADERIR
jgi:hypothetical protein